MLSNWYRHAIYTQSTCIYCYIIAIYIYIYIWHILTYNSTAIYIQCTWSLYVLHCICAALCLCCVASVLRYIYIALHLCSDAKETAAPPKWTQSDSSSSSNSSNSFSFPVGSLQPEFRNPLAHKPTLDTLRNDCDLWQQCSARNTLTHSKRQAKAFDWPCAWDNKHVVRFNVYNQCGWVEYVCIYIYIYCVIFCKSSAMTAFIVASKTTRFTWVPWGMWWLWLTKL